MRKCQSFEIIAAVKVGNTEIVLGYSKTNKATPYATWEYTEYGGYFWGHYMSTYNNALSDFADRIKENLPF